jgi:hypothetical protein
MLSLSHMFMGLVLVSLLLLASFVMRACCKTMKAPQPGLLATMMLVLMAAGGSLAMQFGLGMALGFSMLGFELEPAEATSVRMALTAPIWMLVGASVYRAMLPTTFGKAMVMFLIQAAVVAAAVTGLGVLATASQSPALLEMRQMLPW